MDDVQYKLNTLTDSRQDRIYRYMRSFGYATSPRWTTFENWMSWGDIPKQVPIKKLALPGTHDSGTYELYTDEIYDVNDFTGIAPTIAGPIIRAMAVTQDADIYTQLMEGNRYIDLRFAKDQQGRIRIVHTVFGNSAENIFEQIRRFLSTHPTEVVIIDIQNINNLDRNDQNRLAAIVTDSIGQYLAPRDNFNTGSTLQQFYDANKNAVLYYVDSEVVNSQPLFWYRNDQTLMNPWYNTNDFNYLMSMIDQGLTNLPDERSYMYVSQLVLTINSSEIASIILNLLKWLPIPIYGQIRFVQEFDKLVNTPGILNITAPHFSAIQQWLVNHSPVDSNDKNYLPYDTNILMRDFYQVDGISTLIRYNLKYAKQL